MKPWSLLLIIFGLVAASCHKSKPSIPLPAGSWRWVETDWVNTHGSVASYPGQDTTIVLNLQTFQEYTVLLNGQPQIDTSFSFVPETGSIYFKGQTIAYSAGAFVLTGAYISSTHGDNLTLTGGNGESRPGTYSVLKFVAN